MKSIINRILEQKKFGPWRGKRSIDEERDANIIDLFRIVYAKNQKQYSDYKLLSEFFDLFGYLNKDINPENVLGRSFF